MNTLFDIDTDELAVATTVDQADGDQQATAYTVTQAKTDADGGEEIPEHTESEAKLNVDASANTAKLSDFPQLYQHNGLTLYHSAGGVVCLSDREAAFVAYYRFIKTIAECEGVAFSVSAAGEIVIKHQALANLFDQAELINIYVPSRATDTLYCAELEHAYGVYRRLAERRIWLEVSDPALPSKTYSVNEDTDQACATARQAWQIRRIRAFNSIIRKIRASFKTVAYEHSQSKQQYEHKRLLQRYQNYVRDLTIPLKKTGRRRLLVVRMDLGMREANLNKYDLTAFLGHLEALFWHTERQEVFKGLEGYIRKVEFGVDKGWHAHLILFFDHDVIRSAYTQAERVGMYWKQIVQQRCAKASTGETSIGECAAEADCSGTGYSGQNGAEDYGVHFNCHSDQKRYKFNGIGKLDNEAEDYPEKLNNLLEHVVPYLLKSDYTVRFTEMPKQKLLTRGQLPKKSQAAIQQAVVVVQPEIQQPQPPLQIQQIQGVDRKPQQTAPKPKMSRLESAEVMVGEKLTIRAHRSRCYKRKDHLDRLI